MKYVSCGRESTVTTPENDERLNELIDIGARLLGEIESFTQEGGRQFVSLAQRARTNRRMITVIGVSLLLDVVLTVATVFGWVAVSRNEHRITTLTERLDIAQTVQRQKALCPLYQLLLDSKSAAGRAAAPDPAAYDHAFKVISDGYGVLECSAFISGQ
jgi:hypothetical protein